MNLNRLQVREIVHRALKEDIGSGDITTALTVPAGSFSRAEIMAKEDGVIAGQQVAAMVFEEAAAAYGVEMAKVAYTPVLHDGSCVHKGDVISSIHGPTSVILTGERTALNFLQRMSGIATRTAALVSLIKHTHAHVVDTRKTTPGLRVLEKYAVRMGGGWNHRFGLYDAVLIKDNHIRAAGGVRQAVIAAKSGIPHTVKIEVEVESIEQVREALDAGADMLLLDNMSLDALRDAVALCRGRALTEASGNVDEGSIARVAETGVDLISVGALTHSVKALDLSLEIRDDG